MSKAWASGSTAAWRKIRLLVQARPDGWTCGLCGEPIPRGLPRNHPDAWQAHHTRDRRLVGDDPQFVVPSHRRCNSAAGAPGKDDPQPTTRAWWRSAGEPDTAD